MAGGRGHEAGGSASSVIASIESGFCYDFVLYNFYFSFLYLRRKALRLYGW